MYDSLHKSNPNIEGVIPVLPTPFDNEESIDFTSFASVIDWVKSCGCKTVCLPAFGSEFYKLSINERSELLDVAFEHAGDLKIIVQCNHASPKVLRSSIEDAEARGACAINMALPRMISLSEGDYLSYAKAVCSYTTLPVIVQDFNPGGTVVGSEFAAALASEHGNFRFIKYEIPGINSLIQEISARTSGQVKVLSGWGGTYFLEQFAVGVAGVMPGVSLLDMFMKMWNDCDDNRAYDAIKTFSCIAPYLSLSLQNLEMFHHCEKQLAVRRHLIQCPTVRKATIQLDSFQKQYLNNIIDVICLQIQNCDK